jgi:hypothetical protein
MQIGGGLTINEQNDRYRLQQKNFLLPASPPLTDQRTLVFESQLQKPELMAREFENQDEVMSSPVGDVFSVQRAEAEKDRPLDGQDAEHGVSACERTGNPDADTAGISAISEPASPFDSPKLTVDDGMSDTTLEDGEILEGRIKNDVVDAKSNVVVDSKEAVKTPNDEWKVDLDSATATGAYPSQMWRAVY